MNFFHLVMMSLLSCHLTALPGPLAGKVEVKLHVNKVQFISGEFIFIDCTVRNLANRDLQIPRLDPRFSERFINLVDSNGSQIHGGIVIDLFGEYPTEALPTGAEFIRTFSLVAYGTPGSFTGVVRNLKLGLYRVWVSLADVRSDTMEIQVVDPKPEDQLFSDRLNSRVTNHVKATVQIAIQEARDLIQSYPSSPYLPNAYFGLMSALQNSDNSLQNTVELKQVALEYMRRFADHGGVSDAIHFYALAVQNIIGARYKRTLSSSDVSAIETELQNIKTTVYSRRIQRCVDEEALFFRGLQVR